MLKSQTLAGACGMSQVIILNFFILFLVNLMVDETFRSQGEERYHQYLNYREHEVKMQETQRKKID